MTDDEPTAEEQAVTALFAALVKDSPPSEVSALEVVRLGKAETRAALDKRIARWKFTRNALVAAAVIAVIALIVPHLGNSSTNTAASLSSGSSSAAAPAGAMPAEAAGSAVRSPALADGFGGSGSAVSSEAASSGSAASGAAAAPVAGSSSAASSSASSAAASGAAAGTAPGAPTSTDKNFDTSSGASCTLLPAPAVAAARTAFPAGDFGAAGPVADCAGRYGATLAAGAGHTADLTIAVAAAAAGACRPPGEPAGPVCAPVSGTEDAYQRTSPHGTSVWVYGGGYQVILSPSAGGLSVDRLIAAGRAVIKAIG